MSFNKYGAKKTIADEIRFDSKRESQRYLELKLLEKAGQIKNLELQPKFKLQDGFKHKGKAIREIIYIADFLYTECDTGLLVVEDVKGVETKEFLIKKKIFLKTYGEIYDFRIVK